MKRWTDALFQKGANKFNARKAKCPAGHVHNSGAERALCEHLHWLEMAGEVSNIRTEVSVYLSDARIRYVADFVVFDEKLQCDVWHEFKGKEMARWPTIKKLWRHYGPGILRIWKGSAASMRVTEEIKGGT